MANIRIVPATVDDVPLILEMVRGLAEYEHLAQECVATEEQFRRTLFGDRPAAEVLLAYDGPECAGFALFFTNYSTFLGKAGIYLEDLFVKPQFRRRGLGFALLSKLAELALERDCGRVEWAVLDWNQPSIEFYQKLGAVPMHDWTVFRLTSDQIRNLADQSMVRGLADH